MPRACMRSAMKSRKSTIGLNAKRMGGDPRSNLAELESAARDSIAFAADLPFDDHVWKIQEATADQRVIQLWFTVALPHLDRSFHP